MSLTTEQLMYLCIHVHIILNPLKATFDRRAMLTITSDSAATQSPKPLTARVKALQRLDSSMQ